MAIDAKLPVHSEGPEKGRVYGGMVVNRCDESSLEATMTVDRSELAPDRFCQHRLDPAVLSMVTGQRISCSSAAAHQSNIPQTVGLVFAQAVCNGNIWLSEKAGTCELTYKCISTLI